MPAIQSAILSAYSRGVPLSESFRRLAPPKLKDSYEFANKRDRARTAAIVKEAIENARAASTAVVTREGKPQNIISGPASNGPINAQANRRYSRLVTTSKNSPGDYERRFFAALQAALLEGHYKAIGFEMPRKAADTPALVPNDLFRDLGNFQWSKSRIAGNGLNFEAVRVVPASSIESEIVDKNAVKAGADAARNRGRPTRRGEIISTYDELVRAGSIKRSDSLKAATKKVATHIIRCTGNESGLNSNTIQKIISSRHFPLEKMKKGK
jgi:hypothetical protein